MTRMTASLLWLAGAFLVGPGLSSAAAAGQEPDIMINAETVGTDRAFSYEVTTDAVLSEPMRRGSKGKIIPLSGPSASFAITEFTPKTSYTFVTNLPLAKLTVRRTIIGTSPTRFRHDVSFSGPMASVFAKRLGPGFREALPPTMREIAALAQSEGRSAP